MTDTTTLAPAKKPYLKGLNLQFGLLSMTGSVLSPKRANAAGAEAFKMACPLHPETPHGIKQRYVCEENLDGDVFEQSDCLKAKVTDDGWVLVDAAAAAAVKQSPLPEKTLELRSHPYEPSSTFASGAAYIFQPDVPQQFYATLLQLVNEQGVVTTESGPKMLVGLVAFRKGNETFVRIERWGDQLVLRELVRPEDVDQFAPIDASVDTKLLDMARQLIDAQAEDFDPEAYKASVRDRIATLVEQSKNGEVDVEALKPQSQAKVMDMAALLEQSLAAAKTTKRGKK